MGQGGNDTIQIAGRSLIPAELYGGDGNDTLQAGLGPNILVGGDGNDTLTGSGGRDILVGGLGADTLNGGGEDDLLIAAAFDVNQPYCLLRQRYSGFGPWRRSPGDQADSPRIVARAAGSAIPLQPVFLLASVSPLATELSSRLVDSEFCHD